jgi:hypothetical protein
VLIYFASRILIYWLDQMGPFQLRAEACMQALLAAADRIASGCLPSTS